MLGRKRPGETTTHIRPAGPGAGYEWRIHWPNGDVKISNAPSYSEAAEEVAAQLKASVYARPEPSG